MIFAFGNLNIYVGFWQVICQSDLALPIYNCDFDKSLNMKNYDTTNRMYLIKSHIFIRSPVL